jgi:methyltransferase (TIGR00027 family)
LKLTSSAELIAGVRARESGTLFHDPYAENMAGQHGMALATRFCERTLQLGPMIAARTRHLDDALLNFVESGGRNIVIAGVGWDMRPFRLDLPAGTRFYELDFPTTLAERRKRIAELNVAEQYGVSRISIPVDLRTMPLYEVLADHLEPGAPVFIAWEGMCMYFEEEEVLEILAGAVPLLEHPDSLLWVDIVERGAIDHPELISDSVENFMRGMQVLGEPFTFGTDSPAELMADVGLRCVDLASSDVYLSNFDDPVYGVYRFCLAALEANARTKNSRSFRPTKFHAGTKFPTRPHVPIIEHAKNGHGANGHAVRR